MFSRKIETINLSVFQNAKKTISDWLAEEKDELKKEKLNSDNLQKQIRDYVIRRNEEEEHRQRQKTIEEGRRLEAIHQAEYEDEMKQRMKKKEQEREYFKDLYLK